MDWIQFVQDNHIDWVSRGPNTRRGEISVKCPWCGEDDPSQHLGIVLDGEAWGCHRDATHRGKNAVRLIRALLGCSYGQAKLIQAQYGAADPETLGQALAALNAFSDAPSPADEAPPQSLVMPPESRAIAPTGATARFWRYLLRRGYDNPAAACRMYGLRCALTGRWKDRIIIPVYRQGDLVAWTGRAIQTPVSAPRYLSTSNIIKQCILNEDLIMEGGRLLFVTEGPFDAMKMDYYGHHSGVLATSVFGTSITMDQISILREAEKRFEKVILLFDSDALSTSFDMTDWLHNPIIGSLPPGVKDPGELNEEQVLSLINQY